jgi:hypothetical protein
MPNPFTQYQGEQVPQINILPYTQGIADSLQRGMSDLGSSIGSVIDKYKQEQKMKETVTPLLIDETSKYIKRDDKGKESLDETAPIYIKNFYDNAIKEGDKDGWLNGAMRIPASATNTAYATHLESQKNLELQYKLNELRRNEESAQFLQEVARQDVPTSEISEYPQKSEVGLLYNPATGKGTNVGKKEDLIKELGIDTSQIFTEEQYNQFKEKNTIKPEDIIAMSVTGNPNFSTNVRFQDLSAERDKNGNTGAFKLVNSVYETLLSNGYPQDKLDSVFKVPTKKGGTGVTSDVQVNEQTFNKAVQLLKSPSLQQAYKNKGINAEAVLPANAENKWIYSPVGAGEEIVKKERQLQDFEISNKRYDVVASRWAKNNQNKFIPSRSLIMKTLGFNELPTYMLPNGQKVVQIGNSVMTQEALSRNMDLNQGVIGTIDGKEGKSRKEIQEEKMFQFGDVDSRGNWTPDEPYKGSGVKVWGYITGDKDRVGKIRDRLKNDAEAIYILENEIIPAFDSLSNQFSPSKVGKLAPSVTKLTQLMRPLILGTSVGGQSDLEFKTLMDKVPNPTEFSINTNFGSHKANAIELLNKIKRSAEANATDGGYTIQIATGGKQPSKKSQEFNSQLRQNK